MSIRLFFTQLRRNSNRTWMNILLLSAAVAFFVMSLNLHQNSVRNIREAEDAYSTIAVMEIYGDIDQYGNLAEPYSEEHVGYKAVAVKGFDFSEVVDSAGVIDWDLRAKYAAYIEGEIALEEGAYPMAFMDIIRFRYVGEEPLEFPINWYDYRQDYKNIQIPVEILDTAGCYLYDGDTLTFDDVDLVGEKEGYAEQVKRVNRSEETEHIILYPGVEYLSSTWHGGS